MFDSGGNRYVNESTSYMEVGIRMYARDKIVPAVPSWLIMESRHRKRYRWAGNPAGNPPKERSEEHTSELQSLMRISYAVFCLKKKKNKNTNTQQTHTTTNSNTYSTTTIY